MKNYIYKNEIIITLELTENDVGKKKETYFLDNTNYIENDNHKINHIHNFLNELNPSNTKLYVNNKHYKIFQKFIKPSKPGIYKIKLEFNFKLHDCSHMFDDCQKITEIDLSNFDASEVVDMSYMFFYCTKLRKLNLNNIITKNVKNMFSMFYYCLNLTNLDLSSFDTIQVTNMFGMFTKCENLTYLNLSKFNTENVDDMSKMFSGCKNLLSLNLSSFKTKNCKNMKKMFKNCFNLSDFNKEGFDIDNVEDISYMFYNCKSISICKFFCSNSHNTEFNIQKNKIFEGCNSLVYVDLTPLNIKLSHKFNEFGNALYLFKDCYNYINCILK